MSLKVLTLLSSIIEDEYKDVFELNGVTYASVPNKTFCDILKPILSEKGFDADMFCDEISSLVFENNDVSVFVCYGTSTVTIDITDEVRRAIQLPEIRSMYILMVDTIKRIAERD